MGYSAGLPDKRGLMTPIRKLSHLPELDGLRGVAVLLVLLVHLSAPFQPSGTLVGEAIALVSSAGWVGVDLFFVMSSFLITSILLDAKDSGTSLSRFYTRRVLRIFPLYYVVLFGFFVLYPLVADSPPADYQWVQDRQWLVWLHGVNLLALVAPGGQVPYINHAWSLSVEEHFYLLWPLTVLACATARSLRGVCLVMIGVALASRAWLILAGLPLSAVMCFTPCRVDSLALGAIVAIHYRSDPTIDFQAFARRCAKGACVALLAYAAVTVSARWFPALAMVSSGVNRTVISAVFMAVLASMLAGGRGGTLASAMRYGPLTFSGRLCYGIYMLHPFVLMAGKRWGRFDELVEDLGMPSAWLLGFGAMAMATHVIAWVSWNYMERPMMDLYQPDIAKPRSAAARV